MVARYKKKRLAEMMSSDESRVFKLEGSERGRAKKEVREELKDQHKNTELAIIEEARQDREEQNE